MEVLVVLIRVGILGFTVILGCFAFFMFLYRIHVVSQEKKIKPRKIDGTDLTSSRVTNYKGKKILVVDSNASSSKSVLSSAVSAAKTPATKTPAPESAPKIDPTLAQKLQRWRERNAAAIEKRINENKSRRDPPWDEIEMRRHGLVNRHCDRVYYNDCPSNPSTVDISNEQLATTPMSQASLKLTLPPDSASIYSSSSMTPLATSTPRSHSSGSTTMQAGGKSNEKEDIKTFTFPAATGHHPPISPIRKDAPMISQSITSQYAPGPLNEPLAQQGQQHVFAQEPPNQSPLMQATQPDIQESSVSPQPQQKGFQVPQQQNVSTVQEPAIQSPVQPPIQEIPNPPPQQDVQAPQQNQRPPDQKTTAGSNQMSSLYMEPNLHNSTYAFQKPPTM